MVIATAPTVAGHAAYVTAMPYVRALVIWLISRGVVVLGLAFGKVYIAYGEGTWESGPYWFHRLLRWDSEWYNVIASQGYSFDGNLGTPQSVAYFPLFPLLGRGVADVTGLPTTDALLIVANLASLAAVLLLFKLVRDEFGDRIALLTVALLSFYPASMFLSAGYTEPLVLLLIVACFLMLRQQRFFAAAVFAGLAAGTRSTGVMLLPVILFELWRHRGLKLFVRDVVPLSLLSTAGLWLHMIYLDAAFGRPFLFSEALSAYHGGTTLTGRLIGALTMQPIRALNLMEATPAGLDRWIFLIAIVLIVRAWFRLDLAMTLFALLVVLLPYLTVSGGPWGLTAMGRYNLVSFPLFITAAELLDRARWLTPAVAGGLGGLLFFYSALFSQWQWVG